MNTHRVAVVGSANLDMVFRTNNLPRPGETVLGGVFATHPGGKGANQACAIAKLGGAVSLVGCVGDDPNGAVMVSALQEFGVDVAHLRVLPGVPTGTAAVVVDSSGMNQIVVAPGANEHVTPSQVESALAQLEPRVVVCQLEVPLDAVQAAAQLSRLILNPAPARDLPDDLLASTYILTPNETEAQSLTGVAPLDPDSAKRAAEILLARGVEHVVITLGSQGCFWATAGESRHFQAKPVLAVDTTAAGDAFTGALALFIAQDRDIADAIEFAACVGALAVTRHGAMESMPTWDELQAFVGTLA